MNNFKAEKRENTKTGYTNSLRAKGLIPAILYGGKLPNENISVNKKQFQKTKNQNFFQYYLKLQS